MRDVPRFGLGCAPLGNLFRQFTDGEADAILEAAWDADVRHFDTAPAGAATPAHVGQILAYLETPIPPGLWRQLADLVPLNQ